MPVDSSVVWNKQLVIGTDVGVFATSAAAPGNWVRLGKNLPASPSVALAVAPNQSFLVVATHGRGLWKLSR